MRVGWKVKLIDGKEVGIPREYNGKKAIITNVTSFDARLKFDNGMEFYACFDMIEIPKVYDSPLWRTLNE